MIRIDVDINRVGGIVKQGTDMMVADLLSIVGSEHFFVLTKNVAEIDGNYTTATVLEHFLHGLKGSRSVLSMLSHFL